MIKRNERTQKKKKEIHDDRVDERKYLYKKYIFVF